MKKTKQSVESKLTKFSKRYDAALEKINHMIEKKETELEELKTVRDLMIWSEDMMPTKEI